jgi:hypothetical protein
MIDTNTQAGHVVISNVENPYFTAVNFYTPIINTTLSNTGPLDFYLFP